MWSTFRWYFLIIFGYARIALSAEQKFAIEPQDQTAIIGSRVTLPCRVINMSGALQWTKDDFALGSHRNLSEYGRYTMIGSDEEGDFSLLIESVTLEDNARYQCQVGPGTRGEPGIRSRFATLTVLVPPQKPEIIQGRTLITTEDREIELECISRDGKPAAELTWIDGLGNVVTRNADYKTEMSPNRLVTARSILKITPKKEHHNTTFVCQALNAAERIPQNAMLTLNVKYAPKVSINIVSGINPLIEGMDVRITCQTDANPKDVTYQWSLHDQRVFPSNPTELYIHNISRDQHDSIVKCEAYNTIGRSEDSETLYITYGPKFRQRPRSIQAEVGTVVTLSCDVNANPAADITWIQEKSRSLVGNSPNLTISVTEESAGAYSCRAFTPGFPEINAEVMVYMKGRPIVKAQAIQFGMVGDTVTLQCSAYSVPLPVHSKILWSFNGQILDIENQPDYSISNEENGETIRSSLIIKESRQEHFGNYNCSMENHYGIDTANITLKPQKGFPLLLALVGVLGGVVVVVTVIFITILCQRNKKKLPPPPPEIVIDSEKQYKESDRSSNISDMKLEIRTSSSASNTNCDLDYVDGGCDTDRVMTSARIGLPSLSAPIPLDHRYSINRFSSADYPDPIFPPKSDGHNNNGYVPYVDYSKDYNPPPVLNRSALTSSPITNNTSLSSSCTNSLDLRYSSSNYSNPYLRTSSNSMYPPLPKSQPPPPPYCTLRNGSIPHVTRYNSSPSSQYIIANNSQPSVIKKGSLATHV